MRVGDYVRYRCAYDNTIKVKKINAIVPPDNLIKENYYKFDDYEGTIEKCIIKTSPQIIDLIEIGDIVNYEQLNGGVVLNKKEDSIDTWSILPNSLKNKDIKSVITKEQLKNNMYIVGE